MRAVLALTALSGLGLLGLAWPAPRAAAPIHIDTSRVDDSKLRGELAEVLANAEEGELVPISIVMKEQAPRDQIAQIGQMRNKPVQRQAVKTLLKGIADATQPRVLEILETGRANGDVGEHIFSLWLINVVGAQVTAEVAYEIAELDEVAYLNWDQPFGQELFPVEPAGPVIPDSNGVLSGGQIECGVELMRAPEVWNDLGITGQGVVVCSIDTGCCITHPDLANQIWTNPGEIEGNNIDDDNNGFVDDIHGWSFDGNGSNSNINDNNGHGTHTAGTVAGDGTNGITTGMAPNAQLQILKFWNSFSGELSVWNSMQYGVDNGAHVITASLGWPHGFNPDRPMWRMECENAMAAGLVVVYAAGNEGNCCPPFDSVRTPGDVPLMITAGATNCSDVIAGFSSRGPVTWQNIPPYNDWPYPPGKTKPTVCAPGVDTISTRNNCSGYSTLSGTSMATPHIAGACALILEANPSLTHEEVKQILKDTAIDLGVGGEDNTYGWGRVDAFEAVLAAGGLSAADLTDATVVFGTHVGGNLPKLRESDDTYYRTRSAINLSAFEPNLMELVAGFNTAKSPGSLNIKIEQRNNQPGGISRVRLKNFSTGNFVQIGQFAVGQDDQTDVINGVDATNMVDGTGRIEVSIRNSVVAALSLAGFDTFFDQVHVGLQE